MPSCSTQDQIYASATKEVHRAGGFAEVVGGKNPPPHAITTIESPSSPPFPTKSKTSPSWRAYWTTCPRGFLGPPAYWLQIWSIHLRAQLPPSPLESNPRPLGEAQPTARFALIGSAGRCSGRENPPPTFRWPKGRSVGSSR